MGNCIFCDFTEYRLQNLVFECHWKWYFGTSCRALERNMLWSF